MPRQPKKYAAQEVPTPGIILVRPDERLVYHHPSGAVIYYRRPTARDQRNAVRKYIHGAEVDLDYIDDLMKSCILGWGNVYLEDGDGQRVEAEFRAELVEGLPGDAYTELMRLMGLIPETGRLEMEKKT